MPSTLSQILYALLAATLVTVGLFAAYSELISQKDLVLALLPLGGTFLGATLAFRLNEVKEREKEQRRRRHALDFALFVLLRQHNAVLQSLTPFANAKSALERAFGVPANKPPDYQGLKQALPDIAFLLDTGHAQTLLEVSIEQERFEQALEALRIRNEFYVGELQPALDQTGMINRPVTLAEAEKLLGSRVFHTAVNQAAFVHDHFQASADSIPKMVASLRKVAKELFPDALFFDYAGAA
jgi:hypothetical protein